MIKEMIQKIINKQDLTQDEASEVMKEIMSGEATDAQIASFITALRMKKETIDEITGLAKTMREFVTRVDIDLSEPVIDTCGTGGDTSHTFNISTLTAFVVAASGIKVAKHGNRCISSKCGSADIMENLGIRLDLTVEKLKQCFEETGIIFLFAPLLHPAMKYAIGPRKEIGIRTVFNILGPLTNPAFVNCQVLGVYSEELVEPIANVLKNLGTKHSFVVHGNGLDEITITGETKIAEIIDDKIKIYTIKPEQFGIKRVSINELKGGDIKVNIDILYDVFKGKKGPKRDIVLLNSAACVMAANKAKNWDDAISIVTEIIDSGRALAKVEQLQEFMKNV